VRPSVDLDAFPFHAPWIDAFLLGVPPHAHLVLSLRSHRPDTRVGDVVEAFASIPRRVDIHEDFPDPYLIVGHAGPLTADLQRLVDERRVANRTRFLGTVPPADLVPLLGRGSCYVTASAVDACPASLLQAMACGTPVIAAATPAVLEWVEDEVTGYTFPPGDVTALAAVMSMVMADYPTEVVQRARARVEERADWASEAARLAAVMVRD
jgi:glycosyltransferase involved in cell wall biosynthesis